MLYHTFCLFEADFSHPFHCFHGITVTVQEYKRSNFAESSVPPLVRARKFRISPLSAFGVTDRN